MVASDSLQPHALCIVFSVLFSKDSKSIKVLAQEELARSFVHE